MIGCGNIAGKFDEGQSPDDLPFTHAGAYKQDGRFTITACADPDDKRRAEFMAAWAVSTGFRSIDEALASGLRFDIISICSPTSCHAADLTQALRLKPKLIFCEKPVTRSLAETEKMVAACRNAAIPLAVNYTRRWDPDILRLKKDMLAEKWGQLRSVSGVYNKGILNNGSHMLDLLHFLVGSLDLINVGHPVYDFFSDDPTIPVWLKTTQHDVPIQLVGAHAQDYAIFELQLIFSLGVLTMEDGGLFWRERRAVESAKFKGYRMLETDVRRAGENPRAMLKAVDNIYRAINQGEALASTGESALDAQRLCEQIKQQAVAL